MTGEDHNTDALIAALRSPALPAEQVGEAAAVLAMFRAQTHIPAASHGLRSRRGVAIAAVTVASLGIGGLAAAGPGIFSPAADRPDVTDPAPDTVSETVIDDTITGEGEPAEDVDPTVTPDDGAGGVEGSVDDPATGADPTAESDQGTGGDVECAAGNHGQTVSSVAQATESGPGKGAVVSEAARSDCGKADKDKDKDKDKDNFGDTPGQSGDAPGQSDEAPGQSGDTPGKSGEAPGKTKDPGEPDKP